MNGPRREVNEERFVRRDRLLVLDPRRRLVRHVGHEVVVGIVRQLDRSNPVEEIRRPLVGFAADEAVELVESLPRRPAVEWPRDAGFPSGGFVPFAERSRAVAVQAQHLRQRSRCVGHLPGGSGKGGCHLGDEAHVHRVMVAPGLERGARGRAQCGGVKVAVAQSAGRQAVQSRRRNLQQLSDCSHAPICPQSVQEPPASRWITSATGAFGLLLPHENRGLLWRRSHVALDLGLPTFSVFEGGRQRQSFRVCFSTAPRVRTEPIVWTTLRHPRTFSLAQAPNALHGVLLVASQTYLVGRSFPKVRTVLSPPDDVTVPYIYTVLQCASLSATFATTAGPWYGAT